MQKRILVQLSQRLVAIILRNKRLGNLCCVQFFWREGREREIKKVLGCKGYLFIPFQMSLLKMWITKICLDPGGDIVIQIIQ